MTELSLVPDTAPEIGRTKTIGWALREAGVPREWVEPITEVIRDAMAEAIRQRDSARDWVIEWQGTAERLGQEKAELLRRISLCGVFLEEIDCGCTEVESLPGLPPWVDKCSRCHLEQILAGDDE